jgi:hypothetical protein
LIGTHDIINRIQAIFKESFFGPDENELFLKEEIEESVQSRYFPSTRIFGEISTLPLSQDLKVEANSLDTSRKLSMDSFAEFLYFDEKGQVLIQKDENSLKITNTMGFLRFEENSEFLASLDSNPHIMGSNKGPAFTPSPQFTHFHPPPFGKKFFFFF